MEVWSDHFCLVWLPNLFPAWLSTVFRSSKTTVNCYYSICGVKKLPWKVNRVCLKLTSPSKRPGSAQSCTRQMDLFSPWLAILAHSVSWNLLSRNKKQGSVEWKKKIGHICEEWWTTFNNKRVNSMFQGNVSVQVFNVRKTIEEWQPSHRGRYIAAIIHHLII